MAKGDNIDDCLAPLGYSRVEAKIREWADVYRPSVYKATWTSADVEHFIYLGADIKRHENFVGKFGFRSPLVEEFSIASLLKYGHPNYRYWIEHHDRRIGCIINFDFDRLFLSKGQAYGRPPILLESGRPPRHVVDIVRDGLLPVVQRGKTLEGILRILVSDVEPFPWSATNCIARAVQVFAMSRLQDVPREVIRGFLAPQYHLISRHLVNADVKSTIDGFISHLSLDWRGP